MALYVTSKSPNREPVNVTWRRVDPAVRRQTWVQVCDVTSDSDGKFSFIIDLKEKEPSYQKPLTGGYSLSRANSLKLQWQSNGANSGLFRRYFTYGDSSPDGSFFTDETAVKTSWTRVFKGFPKQDSVSSARIGVYRFWINGAPPNTFLGNLVATLTVTDKCRCT